MIRYWPFGPHGSVGNKLDGIGALWQELNAIGVPVFYKGADGYGPLVELMKLGDEYGVENVGVFRLVVQNGLNYDVPNWHARSPEAAAGEHVAKTLANLPPEFDKRVWLELINEPDKDEDENFPDWTSREFADWLGRFAQECARLLLPNGYRLAMFGFSSGEPELPDWWAPGMIGYLKMCSDNPDRLAVALHEYSYSEDSLDTSSPWLIGRFNFLFDVCDTYGIARPTVLITEFGWTLWHVPTPEVAMPQLIWAAEQIYMLFPEIKGLALWHYGGGYRDIRDKAHKLLAPMLEKAKTWRLEINDPEPPPSDKTFDEQVWEFAETKRVMEFMPEAALQKRIYADGFVPVSNEYRQEILGILYAGQLAERLNKNEKRVYMAEVPKWDQVFWVPESGSPDPPEPPLDPPEPPPPPSGNTIDLRPYFMPETEFGPIYEVRDEPSGAQRRIQHQAHGNKVFITKGTGGTGGKSEWEELLCDNTHIWRGIDTSPGQLSGRPRFYIQYEPGFGMARWCKRYMAVGETFVGPGHKVQFFFKDNCEKSEQNSGQAVNVTTLFAHHQSIIFNGLEWFDVVELGREGGERFWFARGIGMIGWKSEWNQSYISELHNPGSRPHNEKEPICSFTLP